VRVLLCQCYTAQDGRALLPDQCCDLRDEEAAKLIASGAAVAEADAPFLRLHQDWQISGTLRRRRAQKWTQGKWPIIFRRDTLSS
jgi:hypothetical protein